MGVYRQTSLRALAPASLVLFAIAFLVIVVTSLGGNDSSSPQAERAPVTKPHKRKSAASTSPARTRPNARFYTVRPGDNLSTIAAKTGVSVNTLLQLNPSLDPQNLVNGQRVKLPGGERQAGASGTTGATGATGATGPG